MNIIDTTIHGISDIFLNRAASPCAKLVTNEPIPYNWMID